MASEVIIKGCGGQAAVRGTYCLAGDTALFSWTRLLTKEPLPVPPPLPHSGAPRRKHQASRKGGGTGKQARPPPNPNVRCTPVLGEVGVTQAGGTREALLCGCCEALGPGVRVQASRQGEGGRCVTIARPPAPCPPKLHPREGGADKGSGAACPAPDRHGHLSPLPIHRSSEAVVTQDLRSQILRAAAAAVAKGRDARGSTTREGSRLRAIQDILPRFYRTLPVLYPGAHALVLSLGARGAEEDLVSAGESRQGLEATRRPPVHLRAPGMEPQPGGARSCRRGAPGGACELSTATESAAPMSLAIHSTTGTRYDLSVPHDETVEGLRKRLSQRLKVPKERLALLHKDTRLSSGKLQEFGVGDGSKLTLVPTVEAGLMSQASRPEQSVMQALESLTETQPPATPGPGRAAGGGFRKYRLILFKHPWHRQGPQSPERGGERPQVSDFLSGRSPLTLALRVGDHMMFVQLQLAAQHAPLQHRHVLAAAAAAAARGDSSVATPASSPCRPVSSAARVPPVSSSPSSPTSPSPVTAGSFRSHAASTTCPEQMDCSPASNSTTSTPGSSPTPRSRKPGAVIESFVNHAPGVFSGTFSGTLHPNCQDSSGRPRRDIGTILQILNDLLSATRHYQGMPPSLTQLRCHAQCSSASPAPDLTPKTTSCEKLAATSPTSLLQGQSQIRMCKPPGDRLRQTENRATRCKVERLQLLLQQKRLRRKARRDARGPYHWTPSRKAGRSDSSSSGGGGSPGEATGLGLDFEDSVWKPEVNPDIQSEFVVA